MSDHACEDLIAEIFERLPLKSLLRFKSLSMSWCSRISCPEFICRQTLRSLYAPQRVIIAQMIHKDSSQNILTLHSEGQLHMCDTYEGCISITTFKSPDSYIIGSCNGVMCLLDICKERINLWKPSNRRKLTVPVDYRSMRECNNILNGFGFDPVTGDYKIVRILLKVKDKYNAFVYSIKTHTWCEIDSHTIPFSYHYSQWYFVNRTLSWLVKISDKYRCTVTLNLSTEVFGTIELPYVSWVVIGLAIIKGSLAVIIYDDICCIWVMKEWRVVSNFGNLDCREGIMSVSQLTNGDFVFKTYFGHIEVSNPLRDVRYKFAKVMKYPSKGYIETYVDSLALLDTGSTFWRHS